MAVHVLGFHHTGRTVADMERSLRLYCDVLGLEVVDDAVVEGDADLARALDLEAVAVRIVLLGVGGRMPYVELFEYRTPVGAARPATARITDAGDTHPCLLVEDIHALHELLLREGLTSAAPPQRIHDGPQAGEWVLLATDHDGAPLEFWEIPAPNRERS